MKHVSILTFVGARVNPIDVTYQMLTRVNDCLTAQGRQAFYTMEIVGAAREIQLGYGPLSFNLKTNRTIDEVENTDVVIIPMLAGNFQETIDANVACREWIVKQYNQGAEIVGLCIGSVLLASTGLLDQKKCAIHWAVKNKFAAMYPKVKFTDEVIITDDNGIYTSGGGFTYMNLLLYLVEKHLGRNVAVYASKIFEIDIDRKTQNPFMIFTGQKLHGDDLVLKVQEYIEDNPKDTFTVESLCERFDLGRRTFERRFKKCTNNSVTEYIRRVKVEYAKTQLEDGHKTVNEIIYELGYNDLGAFREIFKKYTDLSPNRYRKKFAPELTLA